jgi:hypothetical protein
VCSVGEELGIGSVKVLSFWSEDLGQLTKVRISHDSSGNRPGWLLDHVKLERESTTNSSSMGEAYEFRSGEWLDNQKGDRNVCRELAAVAVDGTQLVAPPALRVVYSIAVVTGATQGHGESHQRGREGTDANVSIMLTGTTGDSGPRRLLRSHDHIDKFERG